MLSHQERPRELKWYHAGPLLYGDLGTSRFYVLGLAFYYALYASPWYILGVGVLVASVGWAYTVICRSYPDGGGVYSAAKQLSPILAVIGALLLFADYAVTAALSSFEGLQYFNISNSLAVKIGASAAIILLGLINYVGPKKAGTFALIVAMATLVCTLILVGFSVPHLAQGFHNIHPLSGGPTYQWRTLVNVVLALSGVEAVANMTGIMVKPVETTSKKAIWPVLAEVIIFNLILGVAMLAITPSAPTDFLKPAAHYDEQIKHAQSALFDAKADALLSPKDAAADAATITSIQQRIQSLPKPSELEDKVKNTVLSVMGEQFVGSALGPIVGHWWGVVSGFIFGLLLLSAVNTVLGGMVSVHYVMARDGELPKFFGNLNVFGVPWLGLLPAVGIPVILLMLFSNLEDLADLYAIGVVGAIAINLTSCTLNPKLPIKKWERTGMGVLAFIMLAIEITLAYEKPHALIFVSIILLSGLALRYFAKAFPQYQAKAKARGLEGAPREFPKVPRETVPIGALATPADQLDMSRPHIMVATRGGQRLIDFSANYAHRFGGILFVLFVRQLNVPFASLDASNLTIDEDEEARAAFASAAEACRKAHVPIVPIYVVSPDVADSILDFAATYCVEALLMGVSRKGTLLRALQGDVISTVADNLPPDIPLLIHA